MIGESKIVIRGKIDDALPIVNADGSLLILKNPKLEVGSVASQRGQLLRKVRKRVTGHCAQVNLLSPAML
jgi:hypothetical protein